MDTSDTVRKNLKPGAKADVTDTISLPGADKLVCDTVCQRAHGATFIHSSNNHPMSGFSIHPFRAFDRGGVIACGAIIAAIEGADSASPQAVRT